MGSAVWASIESFAAIFRMNIEFPEIHSFPEAYQGTFHLKLLLGLIREGGKVGWQTSLAVRGAVFKRTLIPKPKACQTGLSEIGDRATQGNQ